MVKKLTNHFSDIGVGNRPADFIAVRQATEQHPDCFGTIDDWDKFEKWLKESKEKLDELVKEISKAWGPDDIDIGEIKSDSSAVITFKISNGEVPIAPTREAGRRLVEWCVANNWAASLRTASFAHS